VRVRVTHANTLLHSHVFVGNKLDIGGVMCSACSSRSMSMSVSVVECECGCVFVCNYDDLQTECACLCVFARACVYACVRASVRACVRVCVRAGVWVWVCARGRAGVGA